MPAIKLKKVTAEYLAEKEKEEKEKSKEKEKKNLEDVASEEMKSKEAKEDEESKPRNFLDVEILFDKRKRTVPAYEQKLMEWIDSNLIKTEDTYLPLPTLYNYYCEVCQMQGDNVVDITEFNRHIHDKFGKFFGFQENSPYKVLVKERKAGQSKPKPKIGGLKDVIREVINELGNPRKGLTFNAISKGIIKKNPAQRVDMYPNKLKFALERCVYYGTIERTQGIGKCGLYRCFGDPTKEEPEDPKKKKKKAKKQAKESEEGEAKENGEAGDSEDKTSDDEKKDDSAEKKEEKSEEEGKEGEEQKEKKKKKKATKKKKKRPDEPWRSKVSQHSAPQKIEDVFPLAITYQSDPKEASVAKIKNYITRYYRDDIDTERLKKALDDGVKKGMWEHVRGSYHLMIETFNPGRSDSLEDQIAQALVATHEPKLASAFLIKKYIIEYHPNLKIDNRPHLFKNALERACSRNVIRRLTGIGGHGTFQLVEKFFPSPAILAGDSSDEEVELEYEDSDDEPEYIPRPTKRHRMAPKPKPVVKQLSEPVKRSKPKKKPTKGREVKSKTAKYYEVSSEGESDEEDVQEVEYKPKPTKRRGGGATLAKKAATQEVSRGRGKATPSSKKSGKPQRSATKKAAVVDVSDEDSDEPEVENVEYTPRATKSRGGGGAGRVSTPSRSSPKKGRGSAKRKPVQKEESSDEEALPVSPKKKGATPRGGREAAKRKLAHESDADDDLSDEEPVKSSHKKPKQEPARRSRDTARRSYAEESDVDVTSDEDTPKTPVKTSKAPTPKSSAKSKKSRRTK